MNRSIKATRINKTTNNIKRIKNRKSAWNNYHLHRYQNSRSLILSSIFIIDQSNKYIFSYLHQLKTVIKAHSFSIQLFDWILFTPSLRPLTLSLATASRTTATSPTMSIEDGARKKGKVLNNNNNMSAKKTLTQTKTYQINQRSSLSLPPNHSSPSTAQGNPNNPSNLSENPKKQNERNFRISMHRLRRRQRRSDH